jgi:hypothetical protein
VVKADACGIGPVGRMLRDAGAQSFFVTLREAVGPGPAVPVLDGRMAGDEGLCRGTA